MLSGRPTDPALPSWYPNFNAEQERQLRIGQHLQAGLIGSQKHKRGIPKAWVKSDKDKLFAPGYRIDVARKVVSTKFSWYFPGQATLLAREKLANTNVGWKCECFSSYKATYGPQHDSSMIYIETLIEGNTIPKVQDAVTLRQVFEHYKSIWMKFMGGSESFELSYESISFNFRTCMPWTDFLQQSGRTYWY